MNKENKFIMLFDNPLHPVDTNPVDKHRFSTKYLGNFKIEFKDVKTGLSGIIPINPKKCYPGVVLSMLTNS